MTNKNLYFKKFFILIILFFSFFSISFSAPDPGTGEIPTGNQQQSDGPDAGVGLILSNQDEIKQRMSNPDNNIETKLGVNDGDGIDGSNGILTKIIKFARGSIFNLLWVIVVGVLLYIGFRLIIGRGTPDIFKKAIMGFVYLIIGIVLVYSAWAMIQIILGFNI